MSIAIILPVVVPGCYARTENQRRMSRTHARVSVANETSADDLEAQRRVLADL